MRVPYYTAKNKDSDKYYKGFYFAYPRTTYCFTEDYKGAHKVELIHCLVCYRSTDWGLPNEPYLVTIDVSTLQKIGEVETSDEFYIPEEYIKESTEKV